VSSLESITAAASLAEQGGRSLGAYLGWIGVFIAAILLVGMFILAYRRRMLGPNDSADHARGLLDGLRRLRDTGQMTPQEYDAARKTIAGKLAGKEPGIPPRRPNPTPSGGAAARPGFDLTGAPLPRPDPQGGREPRTNPDSR
jgi:hypothetical protein